jgi:hypothetical protein
MRRLSRLAQALAVVVMWPWIATAQSPPPLQDVQAAYLFQFGRFVEWADAFVLAGAPFGICVVGFDPFGAALDAVVDGRQIASSPIVTRRLSVADDLTGCRILFVSPSEEDRLAAILQRVSGGGVLTVGEGAQFARSGGMVAFILQDRKVRFIVNLAAAEAARLRVSSQLLRVAQSVQR